MKTNEEYLREDYILQRASQRAQNLIELRNLKVFAQRKSTITYDVFAETIVECVHQVRNTGGCEKDVWQNGEAEITLLIKREACSTLTANEVRQNL